MDEESGCVLGWLVAVLGEVGNQVELRQYLTLQILTVTKPLWTSGYKFY